MYIHRGQIYTNFVKCIDTTNKFLFSSFNSLNLKDILHAYDKKKIIILMMKKSFKAESRGSIIFKLISNRQRLKKHLYWNDIIKRCLCVAQCFLKREKSTCFTFPLMTWFIKKIIVHTCLSISWQYKKILKNFRTFHKLILSFFNLVH